MITSFFKELSSLTHAIRESNELRKQEFEWRKSHLNLATKQDLAEMEKRLTDAIAANASISPAVEAAALKTQASLDKLDASIPDKI